MTMTMEAFRPHFDVGDVLSLRRGEYRVVRRRRSGGSRPWEYRLRRVSFPHLYRRGWVGERMLVEEVLRASADVG